jgi:sugar phosphate isomerase/epimerase
MLSRRSLLALSGSLAAGAMLRPLLAASPAAKAPEFSLFTKHLVGLPYDQLAETVAALGFKGVEAPVRKGGHVEPERVEEDLPKLVEAFKKCGVKITLMTTDINAVNAADRTEKVLRTAGALGIPSYRMKWYGYVAGKSHWDQLDAIKPQLRDLVAFSREVRVQPAEITTCSSTPNSSQ